MSTQKAGSAADLREDQKSKHYEELSNYHFVPVVVKTFEALGSKGLELMKDIGRKICDVTNEKRSTFFLLQNISMAMLLLSLALFQF